MKAPLKVLWISRHALTPEQEKGIVLLAEKAGYFDHFNGVKVITKNITFPAKGDLAAAEISIVGKSFGLWGDKGVAGIIAGVFPAHVAAAIARDNLQGKIIQCAVITPVAVPAPAVEGQVRKFRHSHWERL